MSRTGRWVYVEDVWCVIILINNSLITKMFWSVVSRPFNRHDNKHVEASGPRTSTIRCFARLWWCGGVGGDVVVWWCFCGGGVVNTPGPRNRIFRCFAPLWWCGGVVVWWCVVILVNNSLIPKMLWSVVSRSFNRHVTNSPMCICGRCVMCDNSHQQLADNKDVLVRGITTL